jgi:hypothetical protein
MIFPFDSRDMYPVLLHDPDHADDAARSDVQREDHIVPLHPDLSGLRGRLFTLCLSLSGLYSCHRRPPVMQSSFKSVFVRK